jgi:uncharacterized protein (DUF58 family)
MGRDMLSVEELKRIRRLQIQAGRQVDSLFAGNYRSAFKGRGMEFEEVRPYVPGDEVRRIDWNVTARTGQPFVKEFREERQLTLILALDRSGSVAFGSGGADGRTDKVLQQARIGAALAHAASRNNDRVGLVAFSDEVETYLPPRPSRGYAWRVVRTAFERGKQARGTRILSVLDFLGTVLRRRSVVCIVSDFLDPSPWENSLSALARRHRVHAFLTHDPREAEFPRVGLLCLRDAETGRDVLIDTRACTFAWSVEERLRRLRRAGALATAIGTGDDPFAKLLEHFHRVERRR